MGKFFGTYNRAIDEKSRLPLPPRLLAGEHPDVLYALKGLDGCLSVYRKDDFDAELTRLSEGDYSDPRQRAYVRLSLASALELRVDARGRLIIPAETAREHNLQGDVVLLGALDHFEVWDKAVYENYLKAYLPSYEELAPSLGKRGE